MTFYTCECCGLTDVICQCRVTRQADKDRIAKLERELEIAEKDFQSVFNRLSLLVHAGYDLYKALDDYRHCAKWPDKRIATFKQLLDQQQPGQFKASKD